MGSFKKKVTKIAVFLMLLLLVWFFCPTAFIQDETSISNVRLSYIGEDMQTRHVVLRGKAEQDDLIKILTQVTCRRTLDSLYRIEADVLYPNQIEIDFVSDGWAKHIVLGQESYCYGSSRLFDRWIIINSDQLYEKMELFIKN